MSADEQLSAYSNVLNELIEGASGNLVLGKDAEKIRVLQEEKNDTAAVRRETIRLQNELFDHKKQACTVYLDTAFDDAPIRLRDFKNGIPNSFDTALQEFVSVVSLDVKRVFDSLNTIQTKYNASAYFLCTSKMMPIDSAALSKPNCLIGRIAFSKIYFNQEQSKGIFHYRFACGKSCGYSNLILIEKKDGQWHIKAEFLLSIS